MREIALKVTFDRDVTDSPFMRERLREDAEKFLAEWGWSRARVERVDVADSPGDRTRTSTTATVANDKVTCACGSTEFRYDESHPSARNLAANSADALVFYSEFEWFDGDDDPGVVCAGCEKAVDLPEGVEIDWR